MDWSKIFSGIRAGEKDAQLALYNYFLPYIQNDVRYRLNTIDNEVLKSILIQEFDSIVNEILYKGIANISTGKLKYDFAFRNYLYDISNSKFKDAVKKYQKKAEIISGNVSLTEGKIDNDANSTISLTPADKDPTPEKKLIDGQKSAKVIDIINTKLSYIERLIITKVAYGFSSKEIRIFLLESENVSLSEEQIRNSCHEVRKKIKSYMKED